MQSSAVHAQQDGGAADFLFRNFNLLASYLGCWPLTASILHDVTSMYALVSKRQPLPMNPLPRPLPN
jgi:hypothetical protein